MPNTRLQSRLAKLESTLRRDDDGSGLVPNSPEWLRFWVRWTSRLAAGREVEPPQITIAAFRAVAALATNDIA